METFSLSLLLAQHFIDALDNNHPFRLHDALSDLVVLQLFA